MGIEDLTPRERAVVAAAAGGGSAQELAEQLGMKRRTVESHLGSIYRKLGVSSRATLIAMLAGTSSATLPVPDGVVPLRAAELGLPAPQSFVGRHEELAALAGAISAAADGHATFVFIGGEAGVGKTTLVAQALADDGLRGHTLLVGRCVEGLETPFGPIADALVGYLDRVPGPLAPVVGPCGGALTSILPGVASRLPELGDDVDPAARPRLVARAVEHVLRRASRDGPVLVVLEDVHWADAATISLLRYLQQAPDPFPVVVVATYRRFSVGPERPLGALLRDEVFAARHRSVDLQGLTLADTHDLVAALRPAGIDDDAVARLHDRCAGNALYLTRLLEHGDDLATGGSDATAVLDRMTLARVDRMGAQATRICEVAAVAGLRFDLAVLEEACAGLGITPGHVVLEGIESAERAGLVAASPGQASESYQFVHDVVRGAVLGRVSGARRARIHEALGHAMIARGGVGAAWAQQVAIHLLRSPRGSDHVVAAHFALDALGDGVAVLGPDVAAALLDEVLAALPPDEDADKVRLDALIALAAVHYLRVDLDRHRGAVLRAVAVARRLGAPVALARALAGFRLLPRTGLVDQEILDLTDEALDGLDMLDGPEISALRARLRGYATYHRSIGGSGFTVAPDAERAVRDARESGDPAALATALYTLAGVLTGSPDLARQREVETELALLRTEAAAEVDPLDGLRLAATLALQRGDREAFEAHRAAQAAGAVLTQSRFMLSVTTMFDAAMALCTGDLDAAAAANDALLGESMGEPTMLLAWFAQVCAVRVAQGRGHEVVALAEQTLLEHGDLAIVRALVASVLYDVGEGEVAWEVASPILANGPAALPDDWVLAATLAYLTGPATAYGSDDDVEALRERLEPYSGQMVVLGSGTLLLGAADGYLGELSDRLGHAAEAVTFLGDALALEESFGAAALAARTRGRMGLLLG